MRRSSNHARLHTFGGGRVCLVTEKSWPIHTFSGAIHRKVGAFTLFCLPTHTFWRAIHTLAHSFERLFSAGITCLLCQMWLFIKNCVVVDELSSCQRSILFDYECSEVGYSNIIVGANGTSIGFGKQINKLFDAFNMALLVIIDNALFYLITNVIYLWELTVLVSRTN